MRSIESNQPQPYLLHFCWERGGNGHLEALLSLGFSRSQARRIQDLPLRKFKHLCQLSASFLTIDVKHTLFEKIMAHVDHLDLEEELQDELLRKHAPYQLMYALFGMTKQEFAQHRRRLGIVAMGRPPLVPAKQIPLIWNSWNAQVGLSYGRRLLAVAQETGFDLRILWPLLRPALETDSNKCAA